MLLVPGFYELISILWSPVWVTVILVIRVKEPHNAGVPHNAGLDIEFHKTHPNHLKLNILVPTYIKTCIEDFLVGIFDHFDLLNV
jgi:hypothetical protein